MTRLWYALLALPLFAGIDLRVEPGRERIRPYETAAIQVRLTGADRPPGGMLPEGASVRVVARDGGWLSKPFRYPGPDQDPSARTVAVLYTAPGKPGRYAVEARYRAVHLQVEISVTPSAPSHRPGEAVSFGPESGPRDFYRDLAEHYAPLVCQETWLEPKADFLARVDYDGDWRGDNNWDNLPVGSSQAYVYYAAMETSTHYFLVYDLFHPRRYADDCAAGGCHENSTTGLILTIRKDGSKYGRLQVMQTRAQNSVFSYAADSRIREGAHRINAEVRLWRDSHPVVFVESGSHGVFGAADPERSRFSTERMDFTASTGVTYRFGGAAARPAHPNDREVSYELLSAYEHWWARATSRDALAARAFADFFRYTPFGNRPRATADEIAAAFWGRKYAVNQARPFWGWYDSLALSRKLLSTGQWGLDPAYAVTVSLKFPSSPPFSLDYVYNPYLEVRARRDSITALPSPVKPEGNGTTALSRPPAPRAAPAAGERHLLSPPAERPNYKLKDKSGHLEFRARVDGSIYLYVRSDQIEVEYVSGRPIDEIRYRFSQPLPGEELDEVKLEDVEGRGAVRLLEWPNAGNYFTAKIRIQDEKPGASSYKFRLQWKR